MEEVKAEDRFSLKILITSKVCQMNVMDVEKEMERERKYIET